MDTIRQNGGEEGTKTKRSTWTQLDKKWTHLDILACSIQPELKMPLVSYTISSVLPMNQLLVVMWAAQTFGGGSGGGGGGVCVCVWGGTLFPSVQNMSRLSQE